MAVSHDALIRQFDFAVGGDFGSADGVVFNLQNFYTVITNTQADRRIGNVFENFNNQTADGFRTVGRQIPLQCLVYIAHVSGTIDNVAAVFLRMHIR